MTFLKPCTLTSQGGLCACGRCSRGRLLQGHPGLRGEQRPLLRQVRLPAEGGPNGAQREVRSNLG